MQSHANNPTRSVCGNEPSFQLDVSPQSRHQLEIPTPDSSPPISPVRKIPFSTMRFEFDSHAIGQRLMEHDGSDAETSSVEPSNKRKRARGKKSKPADLFAKHIDAAEISFAELEASSVNNNGILSPCKKSVCNSPDRRLNELRSFWLGASRQYPAIFRKVRAAKESEGRASVRRGSGASYKSAKMEENSDDA